jgi:hypothetical protein
MDYMWCRSVYGRWSEINLGIILNSVFFRMSVFLEMDCPFLCCTTCLEQRVCTVCSPETGRHRLVCWVSLSTSSCSHFFGVQGPKDFLSASTHRYSYVFFCLSFCSFMCTFILLCVCVCVCVCVCCAMLCLFLPNFTCACCVGVAFTVQYFHEC